MDFSGVTVFICQLPFNQRFALDVLNQLCVCSTSKTPNPNDRSETSISWLWFSWLKLPAVSSNFYPEASRGVWGFLCQAGMTTSYIFFEKQFVTLILHICENQTAGFENSLSFSSLLFLTGNCWSRTWWYQDGRTRPILVMEIVYSRTQFVCLTVMAGLPF